MCFSVRQAKDGTKCQYFLLLKLQWIISMINNNHPSLQLTPALLLLGNVYNQLSSKHREVSSLVAGKTASWHLMLGKPSTPVLCILGLRPHHSTLQGTAGTSSRKTGLLNDHPYRSEGRRPNIAHILLPKDHGVNSQEGRHIRLNPSSSACSMYPSL